MRVFLAGATGVIGRQLLPLLVRNGHGVTAMTRLQPRAEQLRQQGVEPVVCDIFDRKRLLDVVAAARPDAVIHQLTSIPSRLHPRRVKQEMAATNRLRTEGTHALVEAAKAGGAQRMITQSIAFVYTLEGTALATEDDPLYRDAPAGFADIVHAVELCEHTTLDTVGIDGMVLRYGYLYGPGTIYARDGSFAADVGRRRVPIVGDGGGTFSFIHVEDAAVATLAASTTGAPGIYNIVDNEPAPVREWLPWYAELLGARRPFTVPRFMGYLGGGSYAVYLMTQQRGASNAKAREHLGWEPRHASWRDGFRTELAA